MVEVAQGVGQALYENAHYDESGQLHLHHTWIILCQEQTTFLKLR